MGLFHRRHGLGIWIKHCNPRGAWWTRATRLMPLGSLRSRPFGFNWPWSLGVYATREICCAGWKQWCQMMPAWVEGFVGALFTSSYQLDFQKLAIIWLKLLDLCLVESGTEYGLRPSHVHGLLCFFWLVARVEIWWVDDPVQFHVFGTWNNTKHTKPWSLESGWLRFW